MVAAPWLVRILIILIIPDLWLVEMTGRRWWQQSFLGPRWPSHRHLGSFLQLQSLVNHYSGCIYMQHPGDAILANPHFLIFPRQSETIQSNGRILAQQTHGSRERRPLEVLEMSETGSRKKTGSITSFQLEWPWRPGNHQRPDPEKGVSWIRWYSRLNSVS